MAKGVSYQLDNFEQLNLGGYSSSIQDSAFQQLHHDTFQVTVSVLNFQHGSAEMLAENLLGRNHAKQDQTSVKTFVSLLSTM
jgi:hypothetical protein